MCEDFGIDLVLVVDGEWWKVKIVCGDLVEICVEYCFDC